MNSEEIKSKKERLFEQIKTANEELKELRDICKHEKVFVGNYEWRPGAVHKAIICEYCGELIKYI